MREIPLDKIKKTKRKTRSRGIRDKDFLSQLFFFRKKDPTFVVQSVRGEATDNARFPRKVPS